MQVKVLYYGLIQGVAGKKEEEVELPEDEPTLGRLVEILGAAYGERMRRHLTDGRGGIPAHVKFFVADKDVGRDQGLSTTFVNDGRLIVVTTVMQMTGG